MRIGLLLFLVSVLAQPAVLAQNSLEGRWEGTITYPTMAMQVKVNFKAAAAGWQGTIDIPQQGIEGASLKEVRFAAPQVRLALQAGPTLVFFEGKLESDQITGMFGLPGVQTFPFTLERKLSGAAAQPAPEKQKAKRKKQKAKGKSNDD